MGRYEIFSRNEIYDEWGNICNSAQLLRKTLCKTPLFILAGFNREQLDPVSYSNKFKIELKKKM